DSVKSLPSIVDTTRGWQATGRLHVDRRRFVQAGATSALMALGVRGAFAQATPEATPGASPVAAGQMAGSQGMTREEYIAFLKERYGFDQATTKGGDVIAVTTIDIATLNPIIRQDVNALFMTANIFNGLVARNPVTLEWVPDLADSWTIGEDQVTFTFKLNEHAAFHDGTPVTADDVEFSFKAVLDPSGFSPWKGTVEGLTKSHRAIDAHTFELVAKAPSPVFLENTAGLVSIMPKHIWVPIPVTEWGASPGSTGTDPSKVIGSGPFTFVEWVQADHANIARNENYWVPDLIPTIDRFILRTVADQNALLNSLKTGESDIAGVDASQVEEVTASKGLQVSTYPTWTWFQVTLNQDATTGTFGKDKAVRQALMHALDRQLIADQIYSGLATVAEGPQPTPSRAYRPDAMTTHYTYDVEKAKQLLDDAGWVDSDNDGIREKDGVKLQADFLFATEYQPGQQMAVYFQQAWKEIGFDAKPTGMAGTQVWDRIYTKGDFQIGLTGFVWTVEDQGALYRSDATPEKGGFNVSRWANAEFDRLNTEQLTEMDDAKRMDLIVQASNIINEEVAEGVLVFLDDSMAFSDRVHNFKPDAGGSFWMPQVIWVDAS
ncbi:MAG: ABC transporter substrate-binding protein, partial [Thermomicrobiales bacterium]